MRHILLIASLVLLRPAVLVACDPSHRWEEAQVLTRKMLTDRAIEAMVHSMADELQQSARLDPRATVAVFLIEDGCAQSGVIGGAPLVRLSASRRRALEDRAAAAAEKALRVRGLGTVTLTKVREILAREKLPPVLAAGSPGREAVSRETGATHFLKLKLTDYFQAVRLDRDANPSNTGVFCQYVTDIVRGRLTLQDRQGAYAFLEETSGTVRDGYLFQARPDAPGQVESYIEAHLDRPGESPLEYRMKAGNSHLGL